MSRKLMLAVLAVGLASSVRAEEDEAPKGWKPQFVAQVPKDKMKAAFPKGATTTGKAVLGCIAADDGKLADCKVLKEEPVGQGFGAAALSVVSYERIKPKDDAGASVAGRPVRTSFEFLAPGDANPTWLRKPTGREIANVFPSKALKQGYGGRATIQCQVTVEGFLQNCKVRSEAPADMNFGAAGLQLAPQFRMTPMIRGGKPVPGGEVSIPIVWEEPRTIVPTINTPVVLDPPWVQVPTLAEVKAAWPKEATGLEAGQAALRCDLAGTGELRGCEVISELPAGRGFGKAAKQLSKSFRVSANPADAKALSKYTVDVPFRFRDPATPDGRKLTKPRWIRTLTAEGMAEVYPIAAMQAGVKTGQGSATCVVSATGELTACEAAREEPKGLDFGAAAVKAVSAMRMNPWTREGDTVEGLKITIPISFTWEETAPPEAAKPAQGDGH